MDLSIVIPAYNEEQNIILLYHKIRDAVDKLKLNYEILFIDDGSTDNTYKIMERINASDKKVKIIKFRRNFGQTAALSAGFKHAEGRIVIAMDADLQNDPNDIKKLLDKLKEGYDVVSGWRYKRQDPITKKITSKIANILRKCLTNETIHDSGCTLKAYKKEAVKDLELYGEMHRFIPALLMWKGFKIGEVKVEHHPRKFGKTKYNVVRVAKGLLDLIVVLFWQKYSARPIHLFGGLGLLTGLLGLIAAVYLLVGKFAYGIALSNRPLLLLAVLLIILGTQFIVFGLIADMLTKNYFKDKDIYSIEEFKK